MLSVILYYCCSVWQALESEIVAHEPLMEAVNNMAHHMVAKKHPAVHEIESKLDSLHADLKQLKELTAERKLKLTDAVESQTVIIRSFVQFIGLFHCFCVIILCVCSDCHVLISLTGT